MAEKHLGIPTLLSPNEMNCPDKLTVILYVSRLFDFLQDREPIPLEEKQVEKRGEKTETEVGAQFSAARQNLRRVKRQMTRSSSGRWDFTNRDSMSHEATQTKEVSV